MSEMAKALRAPSLRLGGGDLITAGVGALAAAIGIAVGAGHARPAAAAVVVLAAFLVGLVNWRWSVYGLLAYLPVSGVLTVALYPNTAPGVLAKDFLFVLPAYAGFFGSYIANRKRIEFGHAPTLPMAALALLVLVGAFNPELPSPLVPLVGIKVWLLYVPLIYLGYHLVRDISDLRSILKLMAVTASIPASIGIVEAVLVYTGHESVVYNAYGPAASAATQEFASFSIGGATLVRLPSTFSFVAQYYVFLACMVAVTYAWWRLGGRGLNATLRATLFTLILVAAFTSGARGAFIFVPLLIALILVLDRRLGVRALGIGVAAAGALALTLSLIGTDLAAVASHLWDNASFQWRVFTDGIGEIWDRAFAGAGTGADTNAARYVVDPSLLVARPGTYTESWWAKSVLELGLAGLIVSVILFATVIGRTLSFHWRLRDPRLRATSAAFIALLVWGVMYNLKAQYIDIDPLNVYFWLFAGILFRLPALDRQTE